MQIVKKLRYENNTCNIHNIIHKQHFKLTAMKNVKIKFRVTTNYNTYYATSLTAALNFCNKNDFFILYFYGHIPTTEEKKVAKRCGWGVWGIIDNN